MKRLVFFIFVVFFISKWARADILFIDLNNVEPEIAVARQEAAKRGEKLIVIPKDREAFKAFRAEQDRFRISLEEINNQILSCRPINSATCQKMATTKKEIVSKIEDLEKKLFGRKALEKELSEVGANFGTVMISGHDGNGTFYGEFGSIDSGEFIDVFRNSKVSGNVKSLFLLGCNAVTQHTVGATWKAAFPQAQFIAGYEGTGYLRDNELGHQFIRGLLSQEREILTANTASEAFEKFKRVAPKNSGYGGGACFDRFKGTGPQFFPRQRI